MTLKENIRNVFKNNFQKGKEEELLLDAVDDDLEKIADDYAIEFLKFTEGTYSFGNIFGKWYLHANTSKEYTTEELLEIFKKEKGL